MNRNHVQIQNAFKDFEDFGVASFTINPEYAAGKDRNELQQEVDRIVETLQIEKPEYADTNFKVHQVEDNFYIRVDAPLIEWKR